MLYAEAKHKLKNYLEAFIGNIDSDYSDMMETCLRALDDCIEMGLNGEPE